MLIFNLLTCFGLEVIILLVMLLNHWKMDYLFNHLRLLKRIKLNGDKSCFQVLELKTAGGVNRMVGLLTMKT